MVCDRVCHYAQALCIAYRECSSGFRALLEPHLARRALIFKWGQYKVYQNIPKWKLFEIYLEHLIKQKMFLINFKSVFSWKCFKKLNRGCIYDFSNERPI